MWGTVLSKAGSLIPKGSHFESTGTALTWKPDRFNGILIDIKRGRTFLSGRRRFYKRSISPIKRHDSPESRLPNNMVRKDIHVGLVGAGIGGLATAIALRRAGAKVTVLESAPVLREVCYFRFYLRYQTDPATDWRGDPDGSTHPS